MSQASLKLKSVAARCFRYPLTTPVVTSFGRMLDRPAVFVRVEDVGGAVGWGEVWANFPSTGAEHRTRIINEVLAPMLLEQACTTPQTAFDELSRRTSVLALQSGEPGPFAQSIAGIDLALWDLAARREKTALWRMLGGVDSSIKVYASGINPTGTREQAEVAMRRGHTALKLKIGFDPVGDRANLTALRDLVGPRGMLAADANQAWTLEQATDCAKDVQDFRLAWLEEPIRADRPWPEWQHLRRATNVPLAAGENIASREGFAQALSDDVLSVVQPDIAKWGGLSACAPIARDIRRAGKTFCPHYLGGGIGLLASAHLLAGVGGDGCLEVDCNANPLRDHFCGPVIDVTDGRITLTDEPGLGFTPDLASIERYRTA